MLSRSKSNLHSGRLTWNLQITHLERKMIFQTSMIMFHVNLPGCTEKKKWRLLFLSSFFLYNTKKKRIDDWTNYVSDFFLKKKNKTHGENFPKSCQKCRYPLSGDSRDDDIYHRLVEGQRSNVERQSQELHPKNGHVRSAFSVEKTGECHKPHMLVQCCFILRLCDECSPFSNITN